VAAKNSSFPGTVRKSISPSQGFYNNFGSAAGTQGGDYSDIMGKYRDIYDELRGGRYGGGTITLDSDMGVPAYESTSDYRDATRRMKEFADTGGYSPSQIADIRERAISPIRAVYGNAQRDVARQKRLQGGYSPNFAAATAKMARSMSSQLSDATTNINAEIAQRVASNRLASAGQFANLAAGEQSNRNDFNLRSSEMKNRFGLDKMQTQLAEFEFPIRSRLSALEGMRGLYGTTPANTALMGDFAIKNAGLQNSINQGKMNNYYKLMEIFGGA